MNHYVSRKKSITLDHSSRRAFKSSSNFNFVFYFHISKKKKKNTVKKVLEGRGSRLDRRINGQ